MDCRNEIRMEGRGGEREKGGRGEEKVRGRCDWLVTDESRKKRRGTGQGVRVCELVGLRVRSKSRQVVPALDT